MVTGRKLSLRTEGFSQIVNITQQAIDLVESSGITSGILCVFAIGSTASVTTMEFEPALVKDMQKKLEELFSEHQRSFHSETWGDDNGFSHIRSSFIGASLTVPVVDGRPILGTWQQIVLIDHDNRRRTREVYLQIVGE